METFLLVMSVTVQEDTGRQLRPPLVHQKMEVVGPHLVAKGRQRSPLEG